MKKTTLALALMSTTLAMPIAGHAQMCSGNYANYTVHASSFDLGEGHKVDSFMFSQVVSSGNSPLNVMGECSGYAHTSPDGKVRMMGSCVVKGPEGGYVNEWALDPGATRGTWKATAGTGVFAGKQMSGWWEGMMADGRTALGKFGGTCK